MHRRLALLWLPVAAVAAALLGTRLPDRPVVAAVAAALAAVALVLVGRTTTNRRVERVVEQLADERARAERLLERLPLAVLVFSEGGLAYANPAAGDLFPVHDGQGRTPRDVVTVSAFVEAIEEASDTGESVEVEAVHDGRVLAARASVPATREVALVVTDLTESRRVADMRRDFVVNASHELKTPVAGMRALADSIGLAVERDPQRARRMIQRLQDEAARLAQLVRDLLDLARLEEAAYANRRQVDVGAVVSRQLDRLRPLAETRGIALHCEAAQAASVVASPEDVRLIVDNLVENAIRYNRDGGTVRVQVRRADGQVVLEITDTGIGIPAADQDRVFERFYRVDKARSRAAGGTGLGLSLVRNAVQRHGGQVSLDSVLEEGSTFRVVLPVEGAAEESAWELT